MRRTNYPENPAPPGLPREFLEWASRYSGDECVLWPFWKSPSGYARIMWDGKREGAYRVVWTLYKGEEWPEGMEARHLCHSRSCVNPRHVEPGTHLENMRESAEAGRLGKVGCGSGPGKLTEDDVAEILRLRSDGESVSAVGSKFGVTTETVRQIWKGISWRHVEGPRASDAAHSGQIA